MLDGPAPPPNRVLGVCGRVGVDHLVERGIPDGVRGYPPAPGIEHFDDLSVRLRRHDGDPVIRAALSKLAHKRLCHVPALETAVDQKLYAAHAHPFVAFILFEWRARQDRAHTLQISHAYSWKIDVQAQRERAALAGFQ